MFEQMVPVFFIFKESLYSNDYLNGWSVSIRFNIN